MKRRRNCDGKDRTSGLTDCLSLQRRRRNYDGDGKDRISALPDCILLKILSHLKTKQAIQTSFISPRWKNLWKHIPVLSFNYTRYGSLEKFTRFVSQCLSLRDDKASLQALNFECREFIKPHLLKRIMKYVFSHNVQQLHMAVACNILHFPLCNFPCHTLTSLRLTSSKQRSLFPNSLALPALTHLSIELFAFHCTSDDDYAEPFSVFKSLNTLIIHYCEVFNERNPCEENLFISSVSLVNLTISLSSHPHKFKLSTPNLCSFDFFGDPLQNLCGRNSNSNNNTNFSSIKHVKISVPFSTAGEEFPSILFNWLVELALMESLTISLKTLQLLKIDASQYHLSSLPDGIGDFLLQNAPSAKKVIKCLPRPGWSTLNIKRLEQA
ncbi:F-box protein At3g59150-like isoform X2 [Vicia villosa]|uniref:F-box protein At3g59150-like isoform X2 n=1 Tax=Vicia villosa TaxID=3911 RepID=UPI00273C3038|nr:F-box protein At3g59150-like isoform X2 [Vicia villosa]